MRAWLRVRGSHPLRRAVPGTSARHTRKHDAVLLPRTGLATPTGLGCSPFARHYWGNHCCFLFLRVLRCFSSPRSPRRCSPPVTALQAAGLSHSEIPGSKDICS